MCDSSRNILAKNHVVNLTSNRRRIGSSVKTSQVDQRHTLKNAAKRDNAGAVCNFGMGKFFLCISFLRGDVKGCFPWKVVFHKRLFSMKGRLPSKVVLHPWSFSIQGGLSSKVALNQRSSSIKNHLPSKVVFHQMSSYIKGCLPSNVVCHQRLSFIKSHLP